MKHVNVARRVKRANLAPTWSRIMFTESQFSVGQGDTEQKFRIERERSYGQL
mgnify:CR=1 FL=1|jgi:hypothetical protein